MGVVVVQGVLVPPLLPRFLNYDAPWNPKRFNFIYLIASSLNSELLNYTQTHCLNDGPVQPEALPGTARPSEAQRGTPSQRLLFLFME
ncbi:hypothetical protein E2C01_011101 [Portunus trituberculatus]|uniref:Uncharacterized protein n=1 Tax=Portunus trituberculatus TaxID=210409 RepID=A0A5B7DAH5_PORTR|nr:hypothetical protein [Portunus trituberculatus]